MGDPCFIFGPMKSGMNISRTCVDQLGYSLVHARVFIPLANQMRRICRSRSLVFVNTAWQENHTKEQNNLERQANDKNLSPEKKGISIISPQKSSKTLNKTNSIRFLLRGGPAYRLCEHTVLRKCMQTERNKMEERVRLCARKNIRIKSQGHI